MNALARSLVNKVWALCSILRDGGITYQDYVAELSWLLYLRFSSLDGFKIENDEVVKSWKILVETPAEMLLEAYARILKSLALSHDSVVSEIFAEAETRLTDSHVLAALIAAIDKIDWGQMGSQVLGDIYEGILDRNAQELKSGAGQYFTPRIVVELMVGAISPRPGEIVQDPAAGTGGFLISAAAHAQQTRQTTRHKSASGATQPRYFGVELVPSTFRLCLMNLSLHNIPAKIILGSTLSPLGRNLPRPDIVLTNPPFGSRRGADRVARPDLTYQTPNKQLAFLQHVYRALKDGGRAAIVVPDGVLFDSGVARSIRQEMFRTCNVHTILRLPVGLFYAQAIKTNVVFLDKPSAPVAEDQEATTRTWIYDARTELSARTKIAKTAAVFADFERIYTFNQQQRSEIAGTHPRLASFTRTELAEHNDRLDLPVSFSSAEHSSREEDIATSIVTLKAALVEALAQVEQLEAHFHRSRSQHES